MSTGHFQHKEIGAGANLLALPAGVELGQYRIIRKLGQGGFGITYLAEHIGNGELVVIKENLPTFCAMRHSATLQVTATDPDDELQEYAQYLRRFVDEAKLLAKLDHPHIVKVREAFEALGTAYYVMPWVGGKELQKAAPARDKIDEAWLLPILRTMLGTLEYLHGRNIYHRDVKPANILLTEEGSPVLIDFGTARAIISDRSATHVGSPGYSPIEQLRARGKRGPWTDVYSLGATCYRLITGERPPEAFDRMDEDEDPLRPLAPRAGLHARFSPAFLAGIDKALSQRGKDRWQTATEWLAALPVPITHPVIDEPISRSIFTTPITMEQEENGHVATDETDKKKKRGIRRKWVWVLIWIVISIILFLGWCIYCWAFAPLLIIGILFYSLFPLAWLLREVSKVKAALYVTRNIAILYVFAAVLSYTGIFNDTIEYGLYGDDVISLRLCLTLPGIDTGNLDSLSLAVIVDDQAKLRRLLSESPFGANEALQWAVLKNRNECVRLLLAAPGIDVNTADKYGWTPLNVAAHGGHTECVRLLLAAPGIDVNKVYKYYDWTPLCWAASCGHVECVKLLLAAPGIDVNKADNEGATPLYVAAKNGKVECVKLLLSAPGIDVNKADDEGATPLYVAAKHGNDECASLIKAAGGRR